MFSAQDSCDSDDGNFGDLQILEASIESDKLKTEWTYNKTGGIKCSGMHGSGSLPLSEFTLDVTVAHIDENTGSTVKTDTYSYYNVNSGTYYATLLTGAQRPSKYKVVFSIALVHRKTGAHLLDRSTTKSVSGEVPPAIGSRTTSRNSEL